MSTEEILNHAIAIINEPFDLDFEHYEDQDNGQGDEQLRGNDDSALMRLRLLHPNLFRLPRMSSDEILNRAIAIVNEAFNLDLEEYQAEDHREGDKQIMGTAAMMTNFMLLLADQAIDHRSRSAS